MTASLDAASSLMACQYDQFDQAPSFIQFQRDFIGFPRSSKSSLSPLEQISSTLSQTISLPPTSTSSISNSPPSDFHPSPPRLRPSPDHLESRSKKELWRDLKLQSEPTLPLSPPPFQNIDARASNSTTTVKLRTVVSHVGLVALIDR